MFSVMMSLDCVLFCSAIMFLVTTTTGTVLQCTSGQPLGMENGKIKEQQYKASDQRHHHFRPTRARLNYPGFAWSPASSTPWIQVDLQMITTVYEIITQGQVSTLGTGYVKTFQVSYGYLENILTQYKINGTVKVFMGNVNGNETKNNSVLIQTRFIRVHPKTWENVCQLRMELVGCYHECPSPLALGMESDFIADEMITSSEGPQKAHKGRLNHNSNWGASGSIVEPWLQVDFVRIAIVLGVSTQGHVGSWVKTYQISYLYNTNEFQYFKESGNIIKIFSGNSDSWSVVTNYFYPLIVARKIRIIALTWRELVKLRVEYLGCYHLCSQPLGMENGAIQDTQLSASSEDLLYEVSKARLQNTYDGWRGTKADKKPWCQIDFKTNATVKVIATQGPPSVRSRVKKFSVKYSYDEIHFHDYIENGTKKIFSANVLREDVLVANIFDPPIVARFLRIYSVERVSEGNLKIELFGCYESCSNPDRLVADRDKFPDSQIHASSYNDAFLSPRCARLNPPDLECYGWRAASGDTDRWIQVDFLASTKVTAILTQGRVNGNEWISSYVVMYGNDGVHFGKVLDANGKPKVFAGSTTRDTVVKNTMKPTIFARFVRLKALTWGNFAAARLEFEGCYVDSNWENTFPLGMENRLLLDSQLSASSSKYFMSGAANARLNMNTTADAFGGWIAADDDQDPWLQVDFIVEASIKAIRVQMTDLPPLQVLSYDVYCGSNASNAKEFKQNGLAVKIYGVTGGPVDVKTYLQPAKTARFFRIHPVGCSSSCALKVEFYGHYPVSFTTSRVVDNNNDIAIVFITEGCKNVEELGLGTSPRKILNSQISSSSSPGSFDEFARLDHSRGWLDRTSTTASWIQVDFLAPTKVCRIDSLGHGQFNNFVKKFTVSFSSDAKHYQFYTEDGQLKVFHANYFADKIATQHLARTIFSRFIRLHPQAWWGSKTMRLGIWGCYVESDWIDSVPFGAEHTYLITDSQFIASSSNGNNSEAKHARLNWSKGGWMPAIDDQNPWILIDFILNATITAIATQGLAGSNMSFVANYTLDFGYDGINFEDYKYNGSTKVFLGNNHLDSTKRNDVVPHFTARFVRMKPKSCVGRCVLRVEFYGQYKRWSQTRRLGMENYDILDSQIVADGRHNYNHDPAYARLNRPSYLDGIRGSWSPSLGSLNPWLQVDFLVPNVVTEIITQGDGIEYWLDTFMVSFSNNLAAGFCSYNEHGLVKVFQANNDPTHASRQCLSRAIFARFVRLHPAKTTRKHEALRVDFRGYDVDWSDSYELGMENGFIFDAQITTSSAKDIGSGGNKARLNLLTNTSTGGWIAGDYDTNPWLQVDFIANITLTSIVTQGLEGETSRVTKFTLAYGYVPMNLNNYFQSGSIKVFLANQDKESTVRSYVFPSLTARFVRIQPKEWNGSCAMRVEFFGRYEGNGTARDLGMQSGEIKDTQITVSSVAHRSDAVYARINHHIINVAETAAWMPNSNDPKPWLQVDFGGLTFVTGIITKGADPINYYSMDFKVSFCRNGVNCQYYKEFDNVKIFKGNHDKGTAVKQKLNNFIFTRYIRLHPITKTKKHALRVEFLGFSIVTDWFEAVPLGMESSFIPDSQLVVSSASSNHSCAARARIGDTSAWMAQLKDFEPWFQIDFTINTTITALTTQGYPDSEYWVENYTLSFATDNNAWLDYEQNGQIKIFVANFDCCSSVKHDIYPYIVSPLLRITPNACKGYCSLRIEVYGRYEAVCDNLLPLGMENHAIEDIQVTASSAYGPQALPNFGRLNMELANGECRYWMAHSSDVEPWLQVEFRRFVKIVEILTQGACDVNYWVKKFSVAYSSNGYTFVEYHENGVHKEFAANRDRDTVAYNHLANPIVLRFIRLRIIESKTWAAFRVEFVGCHVEMTWDQVYPISNQLVDGQLIASSEETNLTGAAVAKKNAGGWTAAQNDVNPWLQVDFLTNVTIFKMNSWKGLAGHVTAFTVAYCDGGMLFANYSQDGQSTKVFIGDVHEVDHASSVPHYFYPLLLARYVRIRPKTWVGKCVMEIEFYGRYECNNSQPLGMEDGSIYDGQLTSSTFVDRSKAAIYGRLNLPRKSDGEGGAWRPDVEDESKWYQIDLLNHVKITGVATQGYNFRPYPNCFTKTFKVSTSNDGKSFMEYTEYKYPKIFQANFDMTTVVHHTFNRVIFVRFLRLLPLTYEREVALRVEIYGCRVREYSCLYPQALGLQSYLLRGAQLTSSTSKNQATRAVNARLGLTAVVGERTGAWIALDTDSQPWLRVDFTANVTLTAILTQGREDAEEWVTSYEISFSIEFTNYEYYKENGITKIFQANSDRSSVVKNYFFPRIFARYVRLHPKTWQGACALRSEFHGCNEGCDTQRPLGLEKGNVTNKQFTASSVDSGSNSPSQARLGNSRSWLPKVTDTNIWLQVDLIQFTKVTDILIQGRSQSDMWTTLFSVSYSNDMIHFEDYREFSWIKIFNGNFDRNTIIRHSLTRTIFAHGIRIIPKEWLARTHQPTVRMELWGCYYGCQTVRELGMSNGKIRDFQITSLFQKSVFSENRPQTARLFSNSGWVKVPPAGQISVMFIDFMTTTVIATIKTQGAFNQEAWVTTFIVGYKYSGSMYDYQNGKRFIGNNDSNTVVTNEFIPVIATQQLYIKPKTWSSGGIGLRLELYGCYEDLDVCASSPCMNGGTCHDYFDGYNFFNCTCADGFTGFYCETECFEPKALGMEHGQITDMQITSSPIYNNEYRPKYGRLNAVLQNNRACWCPSDGDSNAWLQVDFMVDTTVTSVHTQGNPASDVDERATTFQISYCMDGVNFVSYKEDGFVKIFNGNTNKDIVVNNAFSTPISARYIRIHPITYSGLQKGCLRVEFKGCYAILTCYYPHILGMESGQILDAQISASSSRNEMYAAKRGRLNSMPFIKRGEWMPSENGGNRYFQVDFLVNTTVTMFQVQARESSNAGVKYFQLTYKQDGFSAFSIYVDTVVYFGTNNYTRFKVFKASTEKGAVVNNSLSPVIFARYIRIIPKSCTIACALRTEFYGCYEDFDVCKSSPCQHNGTCHDHFDFFNYFTCTCTSGYTGETCQTEIDECMSYPCLNNGSCSDLVNAFNCSCPVDYYGIHCEYEFIYPIENFTVQPLAPQKFAENISLVWDLDEGSYTSVEVYYNEILCCNVTGLHRIGGECNCLITNPVYFDPDGVVDIRVFAWNSISNETENLQVEVLKDIQNPVISMLTSYATFGSGGKRRGSQSNIFPTEYPVAFNVSYQDGPARTVRWDFDCDVSGITQEFDFQFDKSFPSDVNQQCHITVTLQNNRSTVYAYGSVILKESVLLSSMSNNGPVKINNTITLTILFDKFAPETCMWIDVGDNSSLLVFGDNSCAVKFNAAQINPNIVAEPPQKFYPKGSDTQQVIIQHHYPQVGSFLVRMNASNDVSMVTDETVTVILALECENPNVTIIGMAPNSSNILNAVQVYRSRSISLSVQLQIDCEITEKTAVSWTVIQFVDDPRMLAEIPSLTVSALEKTAYHLNIPANDLFLPSRDLPYGFYEIVARVEMEGLPDVFGTDSFYVQVVQTPWINAAVVGGSFYTVPYGLVGSLNASASVDPDFPGTDGMEFIWLCRDTNDYDFVVSNLTSEPVLAPTVPPAQNTNQINESSGCFGTGRGRLNSTDLILELDTTMMTEDETYTISLYITKTHPEFGIRQHMSNIFFYVAKGLPPALQTNCYKNCKSKVIYDEKLILKSSCDERCYGELTFIWKLFLYDNIHMPEPYNLTNLNEIARDEFEQMACNPVDELDIGIKAYSLKPGKKYILSLRAIRPSGVYGELRYTMLINTPPKNGNCSMFPSSGLAAETNFTFSCENWIDIDAPLNYEFSYQTNGIKLVLFHRTISSGQAISVTDWLGMGNEKYEYKLNITVQIKDLFGSKSLQVMTAQVYPPPEVTLDMDRVLGLVSGESNLLQQYFNSNKSPKALSLSTTVGLILNHIAQNKTTDNETFSDGKISSEKIRTKVLTALAMANMSIPDTSTMNQISATILTLTKEADELTPESQDAALDICKSLAAGMKKLSDDDNGFGEIATSVEFVVGSLGQMTNTSTKGTQLSPDRVKITTNIVAELQKVISDNIVTSEGPVSVETESLSLQVERIMLKKIGQKKNTLKNCDFKPPPPNALGMKEILANPNNTVLQMQPVDVKLAVFNKNPFNWDNTSETIASNVVDIVMESNMNISTSNFSSEASITVGRDLNQFPEADSFYLKPSETNATANTKEYLKYHCFNRSTNYTSMNFEIHPEDTGIHFKVYLKKGGKPDLKSDDFQLSYVLPDLSSCAVESGTVSHSQVDHHNNTDDPIYVDLRNCSRNPYTVFISNQDFNGTGEHCFAVQHIQSLNQSSDSDTVSMTSRKRRSISCEVGARRVRRSCVIIPPAPPKPTYIPPKLVLIADNLGFDGKFFFPNQTPNYNMTMFESSCMHWDVENETWTGEGCRVATGTNKENIVCYCSHLTSFGSDLLVAPNPIDFDSVFQNFGSLAENVAVLALISTILGFYIIGIVWARRADKKDMLMLGPTILSKPSGSYHYLISTYTGSRQGAGTTARVVFKMVGDEGETEPVRLKDRHRPCFERGQENAFLVSCSNGVGDLNYLQIWHDNSGSSPSWYLSRIIVKDLQTGQTWPLFCDNWLAVESEDGKVCRILSVANEQEMVNFGHLFSSRAIKGLADGHIWFSIFSRPPTSNFTRVQRLSCALCLLCCTMITSAMFYNMGGQGPSPFALHIGSLVIDLKPFVIGLQSSVIIVPVNVLLVQIFRNLKPKNTETKGDENCNNVDTNAGEKQQNVPKGKFPYWFIFIAYAICYLASAASIFFTLLYSIQWGKETSTEWVIAMVTSFLQSALLLQPIKVVLVAVVFALIIRKPTDTEEETNNLLVENISAKNQPTEEIPKKSEKKKKKYYSPPDAGSLKQARQKRLKEIKMNAALKEILAFFFFLILLMEVAHYHRDPNTFLLTKTLHETFDELDAFGIDLSAVSDTDSLWMWSRETLVPGLYAGDWYNGKKVKKGWLANMEDYLVGIPRIRLLRVQRDSCPISSYFEGRIPHCYGGYSVTTEEDDTYGVGWESLMSNARKRRDANGDVKINNNSPFTETEWSAVMTNGDSTNGAETRVKRALDPIMGGTSGRKRRKKKRLLSSSSPKVYTINDNALLPDGRVLSCLERWRHQTMLELRGFPNWGTIAWYSGSGYVANLGYDPATAYTVIADLHSNGWVDIQTRAVFVEFTVYNANTNLFGIITIFVEFLPSSGAITKVDFQASRFYLHLNGGQTLAHVLVIFFMLYFLYREGKLVYKQRWAYFKGFWNWIEIVLVISEFALIVIFLVRLYEVDRNLLQLRENPNDYVGFQYAGQADSFMTFVLGVVVFFYTIRFLRILRFNKNFLVIGKTLSRISAPILNFCIPFIFGFFAFALFAYSVFSSELEDYSSFMRTMVTQFSMTLGDFDFEALFMVNPVLATLYFFAFIGLNVMVLMNMFVAIINDSYADIQDETAEVENEFEIVDYVLEIATNGVFSKLKGGKVSPMADKKPKKTKKTRKDVKSKKYFVNDEEGLELDSRAAKLDILVNTMSKGLQDDEVISAQFCSVPQEKKDVYFRVLCLMEKMAANEEFFHDMDDWSDLSDSSFNDD